MESKYDRSADLRPTTVDYDNAFSNFVCLGVTSLLAEYLKYEPEINTVQLRAALKVLVTFPGIEILINIMVKKM